MKSLDITRFIQSKEKLRKKLAKLLYEEKYEIVVRMNKNVVEWRKAKVSIVKKRSINNEIKP
jgi:hypothetical protein